MQNTDVREDSVVTARVAPDAGDTAFQIHCLRRSAYAAVLRAFCAQSDLLSREKQECLAELRNKLKISDTEHREYIIKTSTNKHIKSLSAWFYKGTIGNAEVAKRSLDVKCVIQDARDAAFQIHCLERSAYASVLRASCFQPDLLSWAKLLSELRNELRLSYIEHREVIARVTSNDYIKSLRKFSLENYSCLMKKIPAFNRYAVVPGKIDKTRQSFTSLAPQSPMPAHMMSQASTTEGPCFDADAIVPDNKKLQSGSGSALAYFKCPPCAAQLPEAVSYVVVESPKHDLLDRWTSPCAVKAGCALSPMFQEKRSQSNAGDVPWGVCKDMTEASQVSRSESLCVTSYSVGTADHGSDIIKILLTSSLVNKVQELFKAKPDPAILETVKSILKEQERNLLDALAKLSEVSSASVCRVHPAAQDEVEGDEERPPLKPVSSSSQDETATSSITELRRAEAEREVVEKTQGAQERRELEPEWVKCLSRKRKKRMVLATKTKRRKRPVTVSA